MMFCCLKITKNNWKAVHQSVTFFEDFDELPVFLDEFSKKVKNL